MDMMGLAQRLNDAGAVDELLAAIYPVLMIGCLIAGIFYLYWYVQIIQHEPLQPRLTNLVLAISVIAIGISLDHGIRFALFLFVSPNYILDQPFLFERLAGKVFYFTGMLMCLLTYLRIRLNMNRVRLLWVVWAWIVLTIVGYMVSLAMLHYVHGFEIVIPVR